MKSIPSSDFEVVTVVSQTDCPQAFARRVAGKHTLSNSVPLELVWASIAEYLQWERCTLSNVVFAPGMTFAINGQCALRIRIVRQGADALRAEFAVDQLLEAEGSVVREIARGQASLARARHEAQREVHDDWSHRPADRSREEFRRLLATTSETYCDDHSALQETWFVEGGGICRLELASLEAEAGDYYVHPAVFDAVWDGARACLPIAAVCATADCGELAGMESVEVHRVGTVAHWVAVQVRVAPVTGRGTWFIDVNLLAADLTPIATFGGIQFRPSDQVATRSEDVARILYRSEWLPLKAFGADVAEVGTWLVLADGSAMGAELATQLSASGAEVFVVPSSGTAQCNDDDERTWLNEATALLGTVKRTQPVRVLWLCGLEVGASSSPEDEYTASARLGMDLVELFKRLHRLAVPAQVTVLTRGSQAVTVDEAEAVVPVQAGLWALGRVASLEYPHLWGGMLDLDPGGTIDAEQITSVLCADHNEDQLAQRGGQLLVPRLRPLRTSDYVSRPLTIDPEGSYLITGGLGGLGLQVAHWLVARGARYLILLGRSAMPSRESWVAVDPQSELGGRLAQVVALERLGCHVDLVAADVADSVALTAAVERNHAVAPLRGIVHAAGVAHMSALSEVTSQQFSQGTSAKVLGFRLLMNLGERLCADFIVGFSSGASVWGSKGLGVYAFGSGYMDALAIRERARVGLGTSLNWAMWGDVGMSSDERSKSMLGMLGMRAIPPAIAVRAMETVLTCAVPNAAVADIDWSVFRKFYERTAHRPRKLLLEVEKAVEPAIGRPPAQSLSSIVEDLRGMVARAIGLAVEELDDSQKLVALGVDSISGVGLLNSVRARYGVDIGVEAILKGCTTQGIATLVAQQLLGGHERSVTLGDEPARRENSGCQLSLAQQRLWFMDRLEPGSPVFTVPAAVRLIGNIDLDALQRAVDCIVERHEVLRTRVFTSDGMPACEVVPRVRVTIEVADATPPDDGDWDAWVSREARTPMLLENSELTRVRVYRVGDADHVVLLLMHHVIADGWSMGVFIRELSEHYNAFVTGVQLEPTPIALGYYDFAEWHTRRVEGKVCEEQLQYWKERLSNLPGPLELPGDHARPAVRSSRGAVQEFTFGPELAAAVRKIARVTDSTPYVVLMAAYQVVLERYSGQQDFCVGTPVAGRTRQAFEPLIGLFTNLLPIRADLTGDPTVAELIKAVNDRVGEALANQDVPFERIVAAIQPERSLSFTPLHQVGFALQGSPIAELGLAGLEIVAVRAHTGTCQFDLHLVVEEVSDDFTGFLEYARDLFDASTARRIVGHWLDVVRAMVSDSSARLGQLSFPTQDEQQRLLRRAATERYYDTGATVLSRFEEQVRLNPRAVAVVCGESRITYSELDEQATQIAVELRRRGVRSEVRVGLLLDRSIDLVASIVGVMKAGAAYVPLDLSWPDERLALILEDAQPSWIITQASFRARLGQRTDVAICVEERLNWTVVGDFQRGTIAPADLAYIIYTSGSTGRPKGVMIEHRQVDRLFEATNDWFGFAPSDVWTLFHSCAFDFSVWELWGALAFGGRLVVVPSEVARSASNFYSLVKQEGVTVLNQTPSAFQAFCEAEAHLQLNCELSLRYVIFGGEALQLSLLRPWIERHGDAKPQLVNMYGITETTVHVTYRPITCDDVLSSRWSPIGVPIPDLEIYVLDERRRLVPDQVPGELWVGGAGVSRGYVDRPELNAEKFVADVPFALGKRLYRTGDKVRWLSNGELAYLGRLDHQVKIRGFRIELGEVQAALLKHANVRDAVVLPFGEGADKALCAYVIASSDEGLDPTELRVHLTRYVPEPMVPSVFMQLDVFPITVNGKLDSRRLPAPDTRHTPKGAYVAASNPIEACLVMIWEELLGRAPIGVHEDFFAVGGHSLLAVRLFARIEKALGRRCPVESLFAASTIAALARVVAATDTKRPIVVELSPSKSKQPPVLFIHPSGGEVVCYSALVNQLCLDNAIYGLRCVGLEPGEHPVADVREMAACYLNELAGHGVATPVILVGWSMGGYVAYEMAHQLSARGLSSQLILIDSPSPEVAVASGESEDLDVLSMFLLEIAGTLGVTLPVELDSLWRGTDDSRLASLAEVESTNGITLEELERRYAVFKANLKAMASYSPPHASVNLSLINASFNLGAVDRTEGWSALATSVDVHEVQGDHYSIMRGRGSERLATVLRTLIGEARHSGEYRITSGVRQSGMVQTSEDWVESERRVGSEVY